MIFDVSQTALDLNFDGLMIETHFDPDNAWSDAAQQVTPESLIQIMKDLKIRKESTPKAAYNDQLKTLRAQIDVMDNQLLETLGKRMKAAEGIGALKKQENVAVLQSKRWNEILGKMVLEGEQHNLSEEFILKLFKAVHQESINHQELILNK
jgi:chorismate mutase